MSSPIHKDILSEDEKHYGYAAIPPPVGSGMGASPGGGFEPSDKLRSRIKKLAHQRIDLSAITFPDEADDVYGGHAAVSKAYIHWWKKDVAVKKTRVADDTDLERALGLTVREAEFLVGLNHPNIIELEGFVEDIPKNIIWLIFPWAYNGNLKDFVALRDWKILERVSLINDVAKGVDYLHSQDPPICHGDLKSLNVLVDWKCCASITDFGSARRLTELDLEPPTKQAERQPRSAPPLQARFCASSNTITLTGNKYTLRWAAPELLNEDRLGLGSDIWALGWIVYEVMTNSIPFQDISADIVVVERVIKGDLPSITDKIRLSLIHELCHLVTLCWKDNPTERPTADYCRKAIECMPRQIPKPPRAAETSDSKVCSPELLLRLGDMRRRQGEYNSAFDSFTEALQICTISGNRKGRATALWGLAEIHRHRYKYEEATKAHSEALQIWTELVDRRGEADALWSLAEVHRERCEYNKAVELYSQALRISTKLGYRKSRADNLRGLVEVYRHQCKYNEAIKLCSEALQIRTDLGDEKGRANALWGLAELHRIRREYDKAIQAHSEGLQISTELNDTRGKAEALWGLAEVHRHQSDYKQAAELYSKALHIRTKLEDRKGRADALWGLAEVHRHQHQNDEAAELHSRALRIYTELGNRKGTANALWSLAEVHRHCMQYARAIQIHSEALEIWTELNDRRGRADALWALAEVHQHRSQYDNAFELYSQAMQIRTELDDRKGRADALCGLAEVEHQKQSGSRAGFMVLGPDMLIGNPAIRKEDRSTQLFSEALKIYNDINDKNGEARTLQGLAEVFRYMSDSDKAIRLYSQALPIRTKLDDGEGRAGILFGIAEVHRSLRDHNKAIELYSQALQICRELSDGEGGADLPWVRSRLQRIRNQCQMAAAFCSDGLRTGPLLGRNRAVISKTTRR